MRTVRKGTPGYRFVSRKPEPPCQRSYEDIEAIEAVLARMVSTLDRAMNKKWPVERDSTQRWRNRHYRDSIEPYSPETIKAPERKGTRND